MDQLTADRHITLQIVVDQQKRDTLEISQFRDKCTFLFDVEACTAIMTPLFKDRYRTREGKAMPTITSAAKRDKTSAERQIRNKGVKTNVASLKKKFLDAISKGDKDIANAAYKAYVSGLDKALKKGVIKAGNANRRKSRATAKVTAI